MTTNDKIKLKKLARAKLKDTDFVYNSEMGFYERIPLAEGVQLMKTDNPNFEGGWVNGSGKGVYAIVQLTGYQKTIKIK
tara:strand:- start:24815 stop:25051 length:237 start_codon:yes stop_codon:yes gene_type:complete